MVLICGRRISRTFVTWPEASLSITAVSTRSNEQYRHVASIISSSWTVEIASHAYLYASSTSIGMLYSIRYICSPLFAFRQLPRLDIFPSRQLDIDGLQEAIDMHATDEVIRVCDRFP